MAELASQPTSIQSLYGWYTDDKLYVNRRYQRKLVWTLEEKQQLIDSILKKYPIPAILIAERDTSQETYEIIDGLQRLQAIMSFIETAFSTPDGKLFDLKYFTSAKIRADEGLFVPSEAEEYLSQKEVSRILDYNLAVSVMRNVTEAEVNDVFDRINTFGRRLSDQERRQSGVQNDFSNMVREIACTLRGDSSDDILPLQSMPSISIDLPKMKHGYAVQAEEVFWVNQGILRSNELRDSMDEQCIADIAACIIGGDMIERSKDALDKIYKLEDSESERVSNALDIYGSKKFSEEFQYCVDEIIKVCNEGEAEKLRSIVFDSQTTNPFPSVFSVLLIAFHDLIVKEGRKISNYLEIRKAITGLSQRLGNKRKSEDRQQNVNQIKGLIRNNFVEADVREIYGNHSTMDIENVIRRSEIELPNYEFKQGLLSLSQERKINQEVIDKVLKTIPAIANNGPKKAGKVILGVADKDADASRIEKLDGVKPKKISRRFVVGVNREAEVLGLSIEDYLSKWKEAIKNSKISSPLKESVLSNMDFNSFYGLGIIIITIPAQKELSYLDDEVYWRNGDATELEKSSRRIAELAQRF